MGAAKNRMGNVREMSFMSNRTKLSFLGIVALLTSLWGVRAGHTRGDTFRPSDVAIAPLDGAGSGVV